MTTIEFHTKPEYVGVIPHPEPAKKFIPQWYKDKESINLVDNPKGLPFISRLPREGAMAKAEGKQTVKECLPFRDSMLTGYIIPLWADLVISYNEPGDEMAFNWDFTDNMVEGHPAFQVEQTPIEDKATGGRIWKLMSPWIIKTPPGYSCLITSPFQHSLEIEPITAVVDTDSFYYPINLPFIWNGRHGRHMIRAGTPVAQIIPIKREKWSSVVKNENEKKKKWWQTLFGVHMSGRYSKIIKKKDYN